jgi:hypothetical protein
MAEDKRLQQIIDLVEKLPRRYKAALVIADTVDRYSPLMLSFSCCRKCAIQAMEIAALALCEEIDQEDEQEQSTTRLH